MTKKQKSLNRLFSFVASISLVLQTWLPVLTVLPNYSYAQEVGPVEAVEQIVPTEAPVEPLPAENPVEPTPTENPAEEPTSIPTEQPVIEPTVKPTAIPTVEITPVEPSPTEIPTIEPTGSEPAEPTPTGIDSPPESLPTDTPADPSADLVSPTSTPTETPSAEVTPSITPTPTEILPVEQVCLTTEPIVDSIDTDWNIDLENGIAETKEIVKLGVKYNFPQENKVSVTFNCLPKDKSLRTTLKIEQVKVSELQLPDSVNPATEYAFDITTGMQDGDFEYEVTLPKPENQEAEVSYIEKTVDEVKAQEVTKEEVKQIEESKVEQGGEVVRAVEVDHFTIFIVVNPNQTINNNSVTNRDYGWVSDDQYAVFDNDSDWAEYGFPDISIPSTATVNGIEVFVEGYRSNSRDFEVSLWNVSNNSPDAYSSIKTATLTGSDSTHTLGGSTDLWGETWNHTDFLDANFKVRVDADNDGGTSYLDMVQVKVYYTEAVANPSLSQACGLDIAIVIDNSTSISSSEMTQIKNAMTSFIDALNGTPTQFSVIRFASTASVVQGFTGDFGLVKTAINSIPVGGGYTNWQDGLTKAQSTFDPRASKPNLIIFASDGNPNRTGTSGISVSESVAVADAVIVANAIKTSGTRILALGVGSDLDTANMIAISGSSVDTGDVLTSDVITSDFDQLAGDLGEFASQTCGGTITINKYIDSITPGNLATSQWTFTTNVAGYESVQTTDGSVNFSVPIGTGYTVNEPSVLSGYTFASASCQKSTGAPVGTSTGTGVTGISMGADDIISCDFLNTTNKGSITLVKNTVGGDDTFNFTTSSGLTPANPSLTTVAGTKSQAYSNLMPGAYSISETVPSGWDLTSATCSDGSPISAISLQSDEAITCTFTNTKQNPALTIDKSVTETSYAATTDVLHYSYLVTNSGNVSLTGPVTIDDDKAIDESCPAVTTVGNNDNEFDPGETLTCTASYAITLADLNAGSVTNIASASADGTTSPTDKETVNANKLPALSIVKTATPATYDSVADVIGYSYKVKNTGNVTLYGITVADDKATVTCPDTSAGFAPLVEITCSASYTITQADLDTGSVKNTAYATDGTTQSAPDDETVDSVAGKIIIEKQTLPDGSAQSFEFNPSWSGTNFFLTDDQQENSGWIAPGTYTVEELVPTGWQLTDVTCTESNPSPRFATAISDVAVPGTNIILDPGETVTCTFTNTQLGKIIVEKQTLPDGSSGSFEFYSSWGNSNFLLADGQQKESWLIPGTYSFNEIVPPGWVLTGTNCTSSIGDTETYGSLELDSGETITCIFTNAKNGSLKIIKDSDPSDSQDFVFTLKDTQDNAKDSTTLDDDSDGTLSNENIFTDIVPGSYRVYEDSVFGWDLRNIVCTNTTGLWDYRYQRLNVEIKPGEQPICTFYNDRVKVPLYVSKFEDLNGNQTREDSERFLDGWTFELYDNASCVGSIIATAITDSVAFSGTAKFENLYLGQTYWVKEVEQAGWAITTGNCKEFTMHDDGNPNNQMYFGNQPDGSIHGYKWSDKDENGNPDASEPKLAGWTINLYRWQDTAFESTPYKTMLTDSGNDHFGWYWFEELYPGKYKICEESQTNWHQTYPLNSDDNCHVVTLPDQNSGNLQESVNAVAGPEYNFGNIQNGEVTVYKFNDLNRNGTREENEPYLPDWDMVINQVSGPGYTQKTDEDGKTVFSLQPADYELSELQQNGWVQSGIYCDEPQYSEGVKITTLGEAYGHHGACSGWNGCGNAETCALWACEVNGYNTLVSYGAQKTCPEFADCNLFNHRGSVDMTWYNRPGCPVMGVTDIVCSNPQSPTPTPTQSIEVNLLQRILGAREAIAQQEPNNNLYRLTVTAGETRNCYVGNYQNGSIGDFIWSDTNDDNIQDPGEAGLGNVTVKLYLDNGDGLFDVGTDSLMATTTTGTNGYYLFEHVAGGKYFVWADQTTLPDGGVGYTVSVGGANPYGLLTLASGADYLSADIGFAPPLTIGLEKTNNRPVAAVGDLVEYTIKINTGDRDLSSMTLIDNMPEGFVYQTGTSSIDLGTYDSAEPTLSNGGKTLTWTWTHAPHNSVITVKYTAKIDSANLPASYTNYAYVYGSGSPTVVDTAIVASVVRIDPTISHSTTAGTTTSVLGASTSLPAAGANTWYLILALSLIGTGIGVLKSNRKKIYN